VALVWTAVFLLVLLAFVALAVDGAKLAATRTQLQNAADAAALAGASAVDFVSGEIVQDTAVVRAQLTAARNVAFQDVATPVVITAADVSFPLPSRVRVEVARSARNGAPLITHVARVLGLPTLDVRADATAEIFRPSEICDGMAPLGVVMPPVGWFSTHCESLYVLKLAPGQGLSGNYQLLEFPTCPEDPCGPAGGAQRIRCIIESEYACCLEVGVEIEMVTEPGSKVGPLRQALQARWDSDTDQLATCYSEYVGNNRRKLMVPIVESFDVNGRKFVTIAGFSVFFMRERPSGGPEVPLTGNFINDVVPGTGNGTRGNLFSLRLAE
jgi:hypothetical protein